MATLLFQRVLKWCFAFSNIDVMYCQKGVHALKMSKCLRVTKANLTWHIHVKDVATPLLQKPVW